MTEETKVASPINYKELMEKAAKQAMEAEKTDAKMISFKSGVMAFNGQAAPNNKIVAIVLASAFENQWFPRAYDPKKLVAADCWAVGYVEDDMAPNPDKVTQLFHSNCVTCPNNEWESDPKGGKGKACKNSRRLGLVLANVLDNPETIPDADFLFAKLPVTSAQNWGKYVNQIGNVVKRPPWGVMTEIHVVPDMKTQFKVNFKFVGLVPDELLEHLMPLQERMVTELLFDNGKNDPEEVATAPAAAPAKRAGKF